MLISSQNEPHGIERFIPSNPFLTALLGGGYTIVVMAEDRSLVKARSAVPDEAGEPSREAPLGVAELLERSGEPFDHEAFREGLRGLKERVLEDEGGVIFVPLLWGTPDPSEGEITEDNQLVINYDVDNLATYPDFTLRRPGPSLRVIPGVGIVDDYSRPADPMTEADVKERVRAVQQFEPLVFPNHPNGFNQMNGVTVLTDDEGLVRVSLNCPYPFFPVGDPLVKNEPTLPVPFYDDFQTRLFMAAMLHEMGFGPDFVYRATAFRVRPQAAASAHRGEYVRDEGQVLASLAAVPSLEGNLVFDVPIMGRRWVPSGDLPKNPEEVYRTILTTARFTEDGSVAFETVPSK